VVKGKERPVQLYEVLDVETPERRKAKEATLARLDHGMELYYAREFAKAHEVFTEALALDPDDAVLSIFARRSERFARQAPPPDRASRRSRSSDLEGRLAGSRRRPERLQHLDVVRPLEGGRIGDALLAHRALHLLDRRIAPLLQPLSEAAHQGRKMARAVLEQR